MPNRKDTLESIDNDQATLASGLKLTFPEGSKITPAGDDSWEIEFTGEVDPARPRATKFGLKKGDPAETVAKTISKLCRLAD